MVGRCKVISLSMSKLLEQVRRTGSPYVMITGTRKYPGVLGLPALLQESNAFQVVHAEGRSGVQGVVLLKSTGRAPRAVPTQMTATAKLRLRRCEQGKGPGYAERAHLRESAQKTGEHPER
jgi:hypothetical protein